MAARAALAIALAGMAWAPGSAMGVVTSNIREDTQERLVLNIEVGADRFYQAGFFGFNTLMANVEAGHVWNQHETLTRVNSFVNDPSIEFAQRQYDFHATMVGFVLNGLGPYNEGIGYYYYQFGMAPGATLSSVAIASEWIGNEGEFDITRESFTYGYRTAMADGIPFEWFPGVTITRRADVVNSSWGMDGDSAGTAFETRYIDAQAFANHTTVVIAAGNHSEGNPPVSGPASGYNLIAVGALASDTSTPAYGQAADFSNVARNDFVNPATGQRIEGARVAVDIAAPGTDLVLAAYTGTTGMNTGGTDEFDGSTELYAFGAGGTSFASPTVAGGAALVVDAGYSEFGGGQAVDGRVIKAVLLNSARKNAGWTNHSVPSEAGVLTTTDALDERVGAGMLALDRAYDQYLSGTANLPGLAGGTVGLIGWDFAEAGEGAAVDYLLAEPLAAGDRVTATLAWFVNMELDANSDPTDIAFANLDLQLWQVEQGELATLVAQSSGLYNNVEHLYVPIDVDGMYALRVAWMGEIYDLPGTTPNLEPFAIAWSVPEPGVMLVVGMLVPTFLRRPRRPQAHCG